MFKFEDMRLAKASESDLWRLTALKNETWPMTHRTTIANNENQTKWFSSLSNEDVHHPTKLVLVASADIPHESVKEAVVRNNVGVFKISNVDWVSRSAEVGWDVYPECRSKGFGRKLVRAGSAFCFSLLNLNRLTCEILDRNLASQKVAAHGGYSCEGRKREAVFKEGTYCDSLVFGLLQRDWNFLVANNFGEKGVV